MDYLPTYISRSEALTAFGEALLDLDKPVPDPLEEWRPALVAYWEARSDAGARDRLKNYPLGPSDRDMITGLKAARSLMPKEG